MENNVIIKSRNYEMCSVSHDISCHDMSDATKTTIFQLNIYLIF